jgi:Tol biopolymer transport system component
MRNRPLPLLVLGAALIAVIVIVLLVRQPWNIITPQPTLAPTGDPAASSDMIAPDVGRLIYMDNSTGSWEFFLIDFASGTTTNITNTPDVDEAFPSFSFDGNALTFVSSRDREAEGVLTAYMMNSDGSQARRVVNDIGTILNIVGSGRFDWDFYYGANGSAGVHVLVSLSDLNLEVYARGTDAENPSRGVNLSQAGLIDWFPSLSWLGTQVVFASDRDSDQDGDEDQNIYLTPVSGSQPRRLTDHPTDDLHAVWLDDDRHVLFYSERGTLLDGGQLPLYTLDTQAEGMPEAVPFDPSAFANPETGLVRADISYRNDGRYGVFMGYDGDHWHLYLLDTQSGQTRQLTDADGDQVFAAWQP